MTSYIKNAAMISLCLFIPPLGWLFMYKYSTFDRRTNFIIAVACLAFFIHANISAGNLENIFGGSKGFEQSLTPEEFREKYNVAAQRLAPNLDIKIDKPLNVEDKNFSHDFAPKLTLSGTVDDAGLIATLNPELDAEDRGEVMRDLRMLKEVSTEGTYDWTTTRGWAKYSVHADKGKVIFTAELIRA